MKFEITTGEFSTRKQFVEFLRDLATMLEEWDYKVLDVTLQTSLVEKVR